MLHELLPAFFVLKYFIHRMTRCLYLFVFLCIYLSRIFTACKREHKRNIKDKRHVMTFKDKGKCACVFFSLQYCYICVYASCAYTKAYAC